MGFIKTDPTAAGMIQNTEKANVLMHGTCTNLPEGNKVPTPTADGVCYKMQMNKTKVESLWDIDTTGLTGISIYTEHSPYEFENGKHYFTSNETDIEPVAENKYLFEFAGVYNTP